MNYLKAAMFTVLTLLILLGMETLLLMLATGSGVNAVALPVFYNLDFLWLLLTNNPWSGLRELLAQPVLIIGQVQTGADGYVTALYYYPVNSLLHLGLAWFIAKRFVTFRGQLLRPSFLLGSGLLLVGINYVWLAACCGAAPGWTLDTVFLNYVFTTTGFPGARMQVYETLYAWMPALQFVIISLALTLLWLATRQRRRRVA